MVLFHFHKSQQLILFHPCDSLSWSNVVIWLLCIDMDLEDRDEAVNRNYFYLITSF